MAYLSNGKVAWELPEDMTFYYNTKTYLPPEGWFVLGGLPDKVIKGAGGQWYPPRGYRFINEADILWVANGILQKKYDKVLVKVGRE